MSKSLWMLGAGVLTLACAIPYACLPWGAPNETQAKDNPPTVSAPKAVTVALNAGESTPSANPSPQVGEKNIKQIIQNGYDNNALAARYAMASFLKTWNPIGRSTDEIVKTFGPPSVTKPDAVAYYFSVASLIWIFEFRLQDGKVIEVIQPEPDPVEPK